MKTKLMHKVKKPKKEGEVAKVAKVAKKVLGVTANIRNLLIAVALLFAFLGGFFQVFTWLETTYAKSSWVKQIETKQEFAWENDILKGMYSRYYVLDSLVNLAPDPTKVPKELRTQFSCLKDEIRLQEEKVKLLQKSVTRK